MAFEWPPYHEVARTAATREQAVEIGRGTVDAEMIARAVDLGGARHSIVAR